MELKTGHIRRRAPVGPGRGAWRCCRHVLFGLVLLVPLTSIESAEAVSAEELTGNWSGEGTVTQKEGPTEKVRCRISYRRESDKVFGVDARCASTSKKVSQTGELLQVNDVTFVGDFSSKQYDISGRVRVVLDGTTQTVTFKSPRGEGQVTLTKR